MNLGTTLGRLVALFDRAGLAYMLSGSVASSFYGITRSTRDMDLVIDPDESQLIKFVNLLQEASFYVSERNAMDALRRRSQFNVIDMETAWKADLVIRKNRAFSLMEFSRRSQQEVFGISLWMCSIEDTILAKLEWAKDTESERQLGDVEGMLKVQGETVDKNYLKHWAKELGVGQLLARFVES